MTALGWLAIKFLIHGRGTNATPFEAAMPKTAGIESNNLIPSILKKIRIDLPEAMSLIQPH